MNSVAVIIKHFPYLGIFILLILGGLGIPFFPEDTTLIMGGFLLANRIIKPVPAFIVIYSGLLLSDFSLYLIGKRYGEKIVAHRYFQKIISHEKLLLLKERFKRTGVFVILFGRHLPGLRAQVFLVSGVMKMSAVKFLLSDALSSLFTMFIMLGLGYIAGNSFQIIVKDISRIEHIIIFLSILIIALYSGFKYIKKESRG